MKILKSRKLHYTILLLVVLFLIFSHSPLYMAKEINGKIVDADTGKPLAGVIVLAKWRYEMDGLGDGGVTKRSIKIIESVTNDKGEYHIPAWGPKPRLPFHYIDMYDPELIYFKPRYNPTGRTNIKDSSDYVYNKGMIRKSIWDGKIITLEKFKGKNKRYVSYLGGISSGLDDFHSDWDKYPHLIMALHNEKLRLKQLGEEAWQIDDIFEELALTKSEKDYLMGIGK